MSRPYYYIKRNTSEKRFGKVSWGWWLVITGVLIILWYLASEELSYDPQVIELDVEEHVDDQ